LRKLEEQRRRAKLQREEYAEEEQRRGYAEFWHIALGWIALHLARDLEPPYSLTKGDAFMLPGTDRVAVSPDRMDLKALFEPLQDGNHPPRERWRRFLEADGEAADALESLLELAQACDVPESYTAPLFEHATITGIAGRRDVFLDDAEREDAMALAWVLTNNADARALLSEITSRRDAFVKGGL
jgi:hypothetical protein